MLHSALKKILFFFLVGLASACGTKEKMVKAEPAKPIEITAEVATYQLFLKGSKEDQNQVEVILKWVSPTSIQLDSVFYFQETHAALKSFDKGAKLKLSIPADAEEEGLSTITAFFSDSLNNSYPKQFKLNKLPDIYLP